MLAGVVAVLVVLVAWFGLEVVTGAGYEGLAERVLGLAQAIWPLTVVLSCRHRPGHRRPRPVRGLTLLACHTATGSLTWGGITRPSGRISPLSSNTITPLHNRLHPCSG